ncbi:MAG: subtilase, partial [Nitriliruptoraceae bacterium]
MALATALIAALAGSALAATGVQQVEPDRPGPWEDEDAPSGGGFVDGMWFVELAEEPQARGGSPSEHADERARLRAEARDEGAEFTERNSFTRLWNGLTVEADDPDAQRLGQLDSVEAVYPVAEIER